MNTTKWEKGAVFECPPIRKFHVIRKVEKRGNKGA
jgi:hypothetical protein